MTGEEITKRAFDEFVVWCRSHDPEGEWSVLESVGRYHEWCEKADRIVAWLEGEIDTDSPGTLGADLSLRPPQASPEGKR